MKLAILTLLCLLAASNAAALDSVSVRQQRLTLAQFCRLLKKYNLRSRWCPTEPRPAPTAKPQPAPTKQPVAATSSSPSSTKITASLNEHNRERRLVGAPPLKWSSALEATAQRYANMIRNGRFEHSTIFPGTGENLYRTTAPMSRTSWKEMHRLWIEEKKYFRNGVFPDVTTTGSWTKVGHYTAMVWRGTTMVGCAAAEGTQGTTFVCHYKKQGNIIGQRVY